MSILITCLIVLIVAALLIYAIDQVPQFAPMNGLIKLVIIIIAVLFILSRAGIV